MQKFLGGWGRLAGLLAVVNFAPTIVAIGKLAKGLWALSVATWAAVGPWGLLVAAFAGFAAVLISIVDPGGPLDILGKMFPDTMKKVRESVESATNWISDKIDALIAKVRELFEALDRLTGWGTTGFFFEKPKLGKNATGPIDYSIPIKWRETPPPVPMGGGIPLDLPKQEAPPATKGDILDFLKATDDKKATSNNTYNINVTTQPGADGRRIADQIRAEMQRKPLFDMDGALAPS